VPQPEWLENMLVPVQDLPDTCLTVPCIGPDHLEPERA
jgi:hypothetical protein